MYEAIKMSEAIEKGYLCKPIIIIPDEYKNNVPTIADGIILKDQKQYIEQKKIIGDMLQTYKDIFNGLPVIVPCANHKHAERVTEMFYNAGWSVDHIHSKMSDAERRAILRRMKKGETNILITVAIGIEGMDIPGLYGIIWLRYTESLTIYMQFNGRAMRIAEGKKNFVMVDPVGNSVIHGRPDIDRKWSLDTEYVPGQDVEDNGVENRICPVCGVMNDSGNSKCWICGYDFLTGLLNGEPVDKKKRRLPKFVDGDLVFLDEMEEKDGRIDSDNSNSNNNNNLNSGSDNQREILLTKLQKQEILNRDLTGIKLRSKFKEGIKWL